MRIETTTRFRKWAKGLAPAEQREVAGVVGQIGEVFGYPHRHVGIGIRVLQRSLYECRVGLDTRLIFRNEGGTLTFVFGGNHDQVRRYLRGR